MIPAQMRLARRIVLAAALSAPAVIALVIGAAGAGRRTILVPASHAGFPGWLAGPYASIGGDGLTAQQLATALLAMFGCYLLVLLWARHVPAMWAVTAIVAAHVVVLLAPPLLSADVFGYLAREYNARVEPLAGGTPDDWGYAYRTDRNDPTELSCHASGTAIDLNATRHPNGTEPTASLTVAQIATIGAILDELDHTVAWGGNFTHTKDPMHYEIAVPPGGLQAIGAKLRHPAPAPVAPTKETPVQQKRDAAITAAQEMKQTAKRRGRPAVVQKAVAILNKLRGIK